MRDLENAIGEQKVDVVLNTLSAPCELPIYIVAKTKGVELVINQFDEELKIADIHVEWIKKSMKHVGHLFPISVEVVETLGEDNTIWIEGWTGRFGKLQDYMVNKLIDTFLIDQEENIDGLSIIDKLNKCERLGVVDDIEIWRDIRKARNKIAHESPDNACFISDALNQIFEITPKLLEILDNLKKKAGRL